ncbi:MAG: leucyl/phenylalanyl-tRNA--protein transferase [Victivallaceae bacterium]|nr:leucyl/phenylalanyl-tRNA--protein transferase [Victivallaceae bacterium]
MSDLEAIVEYIALDNPLAARRLTKKIFDTIERLAKFPIQYTGKLSFRPAGFSISRMEAGFIFCIGSGENGFSATFSRKRGTRRQSKRKGHKMFFPEVETADEHGLLGWSDDLNPEMLLEAYRSGIFPWPQDETHILWFAPPERAILRFADFRIPKTVARELKSLPFSFSVNNRFEAVIRQCSRVKRRDAGSWINEKIIAAYLAFHQAGYAWSFEALLPDGSLAGGLYGVLIDKFFAGESMFFLKSGASKFALVKTVEWLRRERGLTWLDAQVQNHFLARFGTSVISRAEYMELLKNG